MKKSVLKTIVLALACLSGFLFSSCENFFNGELLKKNIEKEIEYQNQPSLNLQIDVESPDNGKILPSGTRFSRVTDKFTVTFKPSDDYQFVKWVVKDYKTELELTEVLKIEEPEELETEVAVIGTAENAYLYPLVYKRPAVESFAPVKLESGSPKDSSIVFTFTKNLSTENDLTRIQITCGGDSVASNFLDPVLNENILTIAANKNNLLDVASGKIKTITVKLPADFYYVENGKQIPFGSEIAYSYNVNASTIDKAEVTISVAAEKGEISPKGTQSYNIGDVVKISFTPNADYNFTGWNVLDGEGNPTSALKFDSLTTLTTSFEVLTEAKGISITPQSNFVPGVKSFSPEMASNGVNCDSNIVIKFKSPMSIESFRFDDSEIPVGATKLLDKDGNCYGYKLENEVYYKNIKLENKINGDNLNKYYNYPKLSSDGYILSLTVNYENLLLPINSNDIVNVLVKLNTQGTVKDVEENVMSGIYETQYKLNSNRDTTAPSDVKFYIAKNDEDLQTAIATNSNPLSSKAYDAWEANVDYLTNRARQLKIYVKGYEPDNQLYRVKVYETLIRYYLENDSYTNPVQLTGYATGSFSRVENEADIWEGYLTYDFVSSLDGIVKLDFVVEDYLGNGNSVGTYYINKDTCISDVSLFVASENIITDGGISTEIKDNSFVDYEKTYSLSSTSASEEIVDIAGNYITWIAKINDRYLVNKGQYNSDRYRDRITSIKYEVLIGESLEDVETGNCFSSGVLGSESIYRVTPSSDYTDLAKYRYLIPNIDKTKNYYYKIIAYDSIGNSVSCYGLKAAELPVIYSQLNDDLFTVAVKPTGLALKGVTEKYKLYYSFDGETFNLKRYTSSESFFPSSHIATTISHAPGLTDIYYIVKPVFEYQSISSMQYVGYRDSNGNYTQHSYAGQCSVKKLVDSNSDLLLSNEDSNLELPSYETSFVSSGKNTGKYKITVNINKNDYNKLFIRYYDSNYAIRDTAFESGAKSLTFEIDTNLITSNSFNCFLFGTKGGKWNSQEIIIDFPEDKFIYNIPPKLNPDYIALDDFGEYLYIQAPESSVQIRTEDIICYYTKYSNQASEYSYKWYNSFAHSNAELAYALTQNDILKPEEIKTFNTLPVKVNVYKDKLMIPIKELPNENYIICLDVTDVLGNNTCSSLVYFNKKDFTYAFGMPIEIKDSKKMYKKGSGSSSNQGNYVITFQKYDKTASEWKNLFRNEVMDYNSSEKYWADISPYYSDYSELDYYRVYVHGNTGAHKDYTNKDMNGAILVSGICSTYSPFAYPQYVYIRKDSSYFCNSPLPTTDTVELKEGLVGAFAYFQKHPEVSDLTGTDEIVVQSKYPVLVQTVYSKTNWSEDAYCNSDSNWTNMANWDDTSKQAQYKTVLWEQHVSDEQIKNIQVLKPTTASDVTDLMLYRLDTSEIPAGYFYVITAHFANGDSRISSVHQK